METRPYFLPPGLGFIEADGVGHLVSRITAGIATWAMRGEIFKLSGEFIKGSSVQVTKLLQRALCGYLLSPVVPSPPHHHHSSLNFVNNIEPDFPLLA